MASNGSEGTRWTSIGRWALALVCGVWALVVALWEPASLALPWPRQQG